MCVCVSLSLCVCVCVCVCTDFGRDIPRDDPESKKPLHGPNQVCVCVCERERERVQE